jgi:hypothetical protein
MFKLGSKKGVFLFSSFYIIIAGLDGLSIELIDEKGPL